VSFVLFVVRKKKFQRIIIMMKLAVLVDNNTLIDRYFYAEPALSFFLEVDNKKILFDTGYSDIFIRNAEKMKIELADTDVIVLSHGHNDHTWGLNHFIQYYSERFQEKQNTDKPLLVAHPLTFLPKTYEDSTVIGNTISSDILSESFNLRLSSEPVLLTDNLMFLGEVERNNDFEAKNSIGRTLEDGVRKDDYLLDDSALVYKSTKGLVVITGCSHAGICNIIEKAKKVFKDNRVTSIIGGFHLQKPSFSQLQGTLKYLADLKPVSVFACHCTDLKSKIELSKVVNVEEVGSGMVIEFN
jgi:7,8-dihydropterin-6-yl-methyl-4-(beta-D-ribofuranosyl)aminobenzene 5'-phosphate synthase